MVPDRLGSVRTRLDQGKNYLAITFGTCNHSLRECSTHLSLMQDCTLLAISTLC